MNKDLMTIIALIFACLGVMVMFFRKDIFKDRARLVTTTSGFVVSCVALLMIYIVNR